MKNKKTISSLFKREILTQVQDDVLLPKAQRPKRSAFTLAEVLITLGIIGVVAAITIPTLVAYNQQKGWNTASSVFQRRLGEALQVMNVQQTLTGWQSTNEFVNELSKHIKIIKTCTTPTDCFSSEITLGNEDEVIDITKITKSKNLNSTANPDWGTDVMGVQFADGVSALVAYNPSCKSDPYCNGGDDCSAISLEGKNKNVTLNVNECVSILYDVNGYSKPNKYTETGKQADLRGKHVSFNTGSCTGIKVDGKCVTLMNDNAPVDCSSSAASSSDSAIKQAYDDYCGEHPSGYENDYWAGAKKACAEAGLELPDETTLNNLFENYQPGEESYLVIGQKYWASTDSSYDYTPVGVDDFIDEAMMVWLICGDETTCYGYGDTKVKRSSSIRTLCVGN